MKNQKINKKKSSHVLRSILLITVSLILGVNIYLWNAGSLVGNRLPMPFGYGMAVVMSGSMEPAIAVDDLVVVRKGGSYQAGDVVVYEADGILITHRVYEKNGDTLITWGDANPVADEPVAVEAVKGTVVAVVPKAGILVRFLKQPSTVILLIVATFLLLELSYRKEKRKDADSLEAIKEEIRSLKKELEQENGEKGE